MSSSQTEIRSRINAVLGAFKHQLQDRPCRRRITMICGTNISRRNTMTGNFSITGGHLMIDVPDGAVHEDDGAALPAYDLEDFPAEVRAKVAALAEAARQHAPSREDRAPTKESAKERQRWQAAELRNRSRLEQGCLL